MSMVAAVWSASEMWRPGYSSVARGVGMVMNCHFFLVVCAVDIEIHIKNIIQTPILHPITSYQLPILHPIPPRVLINSSQPPLTSPNRPLRPNPPPILLNNLCQFPPLPQKCQRLRIQVLQQRPELGIINNLWRAPRVDDKF